MRPAVSSKHIIKNSDEDRTKKKKVKSDKKRRRRASSPSSNSSGSEDDSRGRRKRSRRHPKAKRARRTVSSRGDDPSRPRKKRKDSKKPEKRKDRKLRLRRDASVGSASSSRGSSRSCSTCRGRSSSTGDSVSGRSRSRTPLRPDRKAKSRVRGRSKGRNRDRRSRYRSCSFSSCSGCSRSRSRSPEKKYREKDGSKRLKTKASGEREGRNGSKDEDRDKIIRAYDDFRPSRSNDGYDGGRKLEASVPHQQASEKKELVEVAAAVGRDVRNTQGEDGAYKKGEEVISSEATSQPGKDSDDRWDDSLAREIRSMKNPSVGKNSEVIATTGSSKAEDLESILRQKALENLRKFRGGISTSTRFLGDRRDEAAGIEPCKDGGRAVEATRIRETAKRCVKSVICKPDSFTENHSTHGEDRSLEVRDESVTNQMVEITHSIPVSDCKISNSKKGLNTPNQLTRVHDSSNEMYAQKASLAKGIRGNNRVVEGNTADGPASGTSGLDTENQNCKSDKPMVENSCGSQFEQRTFSRVHDGEKVEVSYKVYIPKKSPALARRQLQR